MREIVLDGMRVQVVEPGDPASPDDRCGRCGRGPGSAFHRHLCPMLGTPPPPPELGSDLRTAEDVRRWLGHPSNQFDTPVFIVRWDGHVPKLRRSDAERLWEGTGLARAVVEEQLRRKRLLGPGGEEG